MADEISSLQRDEFLKRFYEQLLGVNCLNQYDFEQGAKEIHDAAAKIVPRYLVRKKDDFAPTKPLEPALTCQQGKIILKTIVPYKKWEVIMNCYGTLKACNCSTLDRQKFFTNINLVLDGTKPGNFWKFVKESCVPNCKFEEAFVTTDDDSSTPTYLCSLVATKDIKSGETIRVDSNHLRGLPPRDYDCSCEEEGCVKDITSKFRCGVVSCTDRGKRFANPTDFKQHMSTKHATEIEVEEPIKVKHVESFNCPITSCNKKFVQRVSLYRHLRECHEMKEKEECPDCGKKFARKQTLEKHRLNACKGNMVVRSKNKIIKRVSLERDTLSTAAKKMCNSVG